MRIARQPKVRPEHSTPTVGGRESSQSPDGQPAILRLQVTVGNRSVQRLLGEPSTVPGPVDAAIRGRGPGEPLPDGFGTLLSGVYGSNLAAVRVHTDTRSAEAADAAGAEAFAYGTDLYFGRGRYDPTTPHGRTVLSHEVAHAVQQGGPAREPARETGREGDAAEREAAHAASHAQRGEPVALGSAPARVQYFAQGDGSEERGGHAFMTEAVLGGMGLSARESRAGRMGNWERDLSQVLTPATVPLVSGIMPMLNIMAIKEFGRGINLASFGTYDPVEHIDNPTGLRGTDVIGQGQMRADGVNPDRPGPGGSIAPAGGDSEAYADIDTRYKKTGQPQQGALMNPKDAAAYQVDESGIPRYIGASKTWLLGTLKTAARLGRQRTATGDAQLRGPRMFASGVHTLQDYFAHSNFCEIAINMLVREGSLKVMNPAGVLEAVARDRVLNTQVQANGPDGNPVPGNLGYAGREVLTTGSFNLTDTAASVLEEVSDTWKTLNPFKEKTKGPSKLTEACLDYLDMTPGNPTKFSQVGKTAAAAIRRVTRTLSLAPDVILAPLNTLADNLEHREHTARDAYRWISDHGPLDILKRQAKAIPLVGPAIAGGIEGVQEGIRAAQEAALGAAWNWVIDEGVKRINQVIEKIKAQTNVQNKKAPLAGPARLLQPSTWANPATNWLAKKFGNVSDMYDPATGPRNGIAPQAYTPPSHTQVAKDHGELHNPVPDGQKDEGHGGDEHGHSHISSWLSPLAQQIAAQATEAAGKAVSMVWDRVDAGETVAADDPGLTEIDIQVNQFFRHPADIRPIWESLFIARLQSRALGPELLEHLRDARASVPDSLPAAPR